MAVAFWCWVCVWHLAPIDGRPTNLPSLLSVSFHPLSFWTCVQPLCWIADVKEPVSVHSNLNGTVLKLAGVHRFVPIGLRSAVTLCLSDAKTICSFPEDCFGGGYYTNAHLCSQNSQTIHRCKLFLKIIFLKRGFVRRVSLQFFSIANTFFESMPRFLQTLNTNPKTTHTKCKILYISCKMQLCFQNSVMSPQKGTLFSNDKHSPLYE